MRDYRIILHVNGILLMVLAVAMLLPMAADMVIDHPDWRVFAICAFFTAFAGGTLYFGNRADYRALGIKQAFLLTVSCWFVAPVASAFPFLLSDLDISFTDALFEAVSGFTTTGASVLSGLDELPPGILLWRSLSNWLGGIGFIVLAVAVLPMLRVGGMQLFRTESSENADKMLPRTAQIASAIGSVYLVLTILCAFSFWMAGMGEFDALNHAMSTVSTAGFSTHDASFGYFRSATIEMLAVLFMLLGSLPFMLLFQALKGRPIELLRYSQVRWYLYYVLIAIMLMTWWLVLNDFYTPIEALRYAAFNVVSVITTSGFASTDYNQWGTFALGLIFLISAAGGCTGSTSGGIKMFRIQVLYETARQQLHHLIHPHGVFVPQYNSRPIPEAITASVMSFIILWGISFTFIAIGATFFGLDFVTALSGTVATLANVGPGLGDIIGPAGNYAEIHAGAKWLFMFAMVLGRLELFTILVLFSPLFWRD